MIAIAPAPRREAGRLLNAKVAEVRFITVVLSFACPAVAAWLSRCAILDAGGQTFAGDNALGRMVPRNRTREAGPGGWGGLREAIGTGTRSWRCLARKRWANGDHSIGPRLGPVANARGGRASSESTTGQGKGSVPDNLAGGRARPRSTWPGTPFAARLVSLPFRVSCRGTARFVSAPVAELLHLYRACFDRIAMRKTHPSVRQRCRCDCRIADHLISSIFGLVMDLATYRQVLCGPALPSRVRQLHRGAWTGLSMG
jgi:hypothetical protein